MAQAVPVVALAEMGTKDVLRAGYGALIAAHEVEDFAASALSLLRQPDAAVQLGKRGEEYARGWSAGALAEKMLDFYRRTIERHVEVPTNALHHGVNDCLSVGKDCT